MDDPLKSKFILQFGGRLWSRSKAEFDSIFISIFIQNSEDTLLEIMHLGFKVVLLMKLVQGHVGDRQRRYLLFTPNTQYGVFATVSITLPEPNNLVNVAWFFEANYYNVANSSYFDPLLGDIVSISRSREERASERNEILTRSSLYALIEAMMKKHGYHGRTCLLRSICEGATTHFSHNGLLGDLFHLVLTPSASLAEDDLDDCYYEAEYYGLDQSCSSYHKLCPSSPLDKFSMYIDHLL